ncbi:MAG: glycosyltransferase [Afipia felis]|nr:glycosyltransferase [Afipia felis]
MPDPSAATHRLSETDPQSGHGGDDADRNGTAPHPAQNTQTRALTVLIAVPTLESGASDLNALALTQYLAAHGHHPIVVSQGGRLVPEIVAAGGEFIDMNVASRNPYRMLRCMRQLSLLIANRRCNVVHALGRAPGWSAYLAARAQRRPFVTTWFKGFREQNRLKRLYNSVMVRGDRIIAASDDLADLIRDRYPAVRDRIMTLPLGFDATAFDPDRVTPERIARIRHAFGAGTDTRIILAPGRMVRRKGHHHIVQAAAWMKAAGVRDFLIAFTGEDQGRTHFTGQLWDLVLSTGTTDVVRFAGLSDDLPAALAVSAAAVFASTQPEGALRTILAAQAMGVPVVASDLAAGSGIMLAPPAITEDRMTGLRFPAGDIEALAAALTRLLNLSEPARHAIGVRGQAWVSDLQEPAAVAERTLRLYMELTAARTP